MLRKNWTIVVMFQIATTLGATVEHFVNADSPNRLTGLELFRLFGLILIASVPLMLLERLVVRLKKNPIRHLFEEVSIIQVFYLWSLTALFLPVLGILSLQDKSELFRKLLQSYLETLGVIMLISWPIGILLVLYNHKQQNMEDSTGKGSRVSVSEPAYHPIE